MILGMIQNADKDGRINFTEFKTLSNVKMSIYQLHLQNLQSKRDGRIDPSASGVSAAASISFPSYPTTSLSTSIRFQVDIES